MGVSPSRVPEGAGGPEGGSQDGPAERGHRVHPHQAADERALAALQQTHDVWTHVVSVLLSEVLLTSHTFHYSYITITTSNNTAFMKCVYMEGKAL